ncbi:MAG TPA: glycosyltransferase family 4 protein [Phycisphaerae bacterium]|mgnify:CR=1 FL=1|nr:glycosyltransferase family 4 protein [Phycisphaerae bacterium]HRR84504.1 glycosyltransferase family 4 protein [Phycisphaerae bacterium]
MDRLSGHHPARSDGSQGSDDRSRVLHVGPLPPPVGGMATNVEAFLCSDVARSFAIRNVRVDLIGKSRYRGFLRKLANLINAAVLTAVVASMVVVWRPVLVHVRTNSWGGFFEKAFLVLLARLGRCRTILQVHGGAFAEFYDQAGWLGKKAIRRVLAVPDRVIAISREMQGTLCRVSSRPDRVTVVENAVFVPQRTIWDVKEAAGSQRGQAPVKILFLNRVEPAKGIWELLEALGTVLERSNACARIVGPEPDCGGELMSRIGQLGLQDRIRLEPAVQGQAKEKAYLSADIYVLPSHVEGMPLGLLEAMSYGLPCIATPVGGVPSVIDHDRNGLLVPPKDPRALAAAILRLTQDASARRRLGSVARQTIVDRFSWDRRAKEFVSLYRDVLETATSDRRR